MIKLFCESVAKENVRKRVVNNRPYMKVIRKHVVVYCTTKYFLVDINESFADGILHDPGCIGQVHFDQDPASVCAHRAAAEGENLCNLVDGLPRTDHAHHFKLPVG